MISKFIVDLDGNIQEPTTPIPGDWVLTRELVTFVGVTVNEKHIKTLISTGNKTLVNSLGNIIFPSTDERRRLPSNHDKRKERFLHRLTTWKNIQIPILWNKKTLLRAAFETGQMINLFHKTFHIDHNTVGNMIVKDWVRIGFENTFSNKVFLYHGDQLQIPDNVEEIYLKVYA